MPEAYTQTSTAQLNSWNQVASNVAQTFNQPYVPLITTYTTNTSYISIWNLLSSTYSFNTISGTWGGL